MQSVDFVLNHYPSDCRPGQIQSLGSAGGFSGAEFWKISSSRGWLCLRRWPSEHPSQGRIEFIHRLLEHVVQEGFTLVPSPIVLSTDSSQTYLKHEGHFWELAPWMPGKADYQTNRSVNKLTAAMQALASFHQAAEKLVSRSPQLDVPLTIRERSEQLDWWLHSGMKRLEIQTGHLNRTRIYELPEWKKQIINHAQKYINYERSALSSLRDCKVPIQACIRDIWHQHILYLGDQVSGVVDFGAARPDTVVSDITRLLGSLAGDDRSRWNLGLDAYESICPLNHQERLLLEPLDRSAVLLAGLNWLRWLYLENRYFSDETAVAMRLKQVVGRLGKIRAEIE